MKTKKLMVGILCATMLLTTRVVFADGAKQNIKAVPVKMNIDRFVFGSFTATVKEINDQFISLEDQGGLPLNMVISKDTYVVGDKKIEVGDTVSGYYNANAPMITIYPPQYSPLVVVIENQDRSVKVDTFDQDLLSSDKALKLNISEDTKLVTTDGKVFKGELGGKRLVVIYNMSTKSIPAQTTPIKVIVLPGQSEDSQEKPSKDTSQLPIVVKGKKIHGFTAVLNDKGTVMVPIRPIVEALGFSVVWESQSESIYVGAIASLTIGEQYYTYAKTTPIKLTTAPELIKGTTYVPLDFFTKVMKRDQAKAFDTQIIIK